MMEEEQLYGVCTSLIGNYAGSERRMTCMSVGGNKYDFTLLRTENSPRSIDILECMDGMKKELDCERGGKTTYGNWQYKYDIGDLITSDVANAVFCRADYNKGTCMDQQVFYARDNAVKFQA